VVAVAAVLALASLEAVLAVGAVGALDVALLAWKKKKEKTRWKQEMGNRVSFFPFLLCAS
jgi:hypothetical protein